MKIETKVPALIELTQAEMDQALASAAGQVLEEGLEGVPQHLLFRTLNLIVENMNLRVQVYRAEQQLLQLEEQIHQLETDINLLRKQVDS